MFRRSRFSIRPNVGTAGRTAATPQEAPSVNQEADVTPKDVGESSAGAAVTPSEKSTAPGDDQNGEGSSSSAAVQRRKRFSIKPKVAPGRPSTLARTPLAPVKAVSAAPIEVPVSDLDKPTTTATAAPQGLQSPRRRRLSEESKQPKVQPKPTLSPSDSSGPSAVPLAEDSGEQTQPPSEGSKQLESTSGSPVKEVPSRLTDKVPPSLPDRESIEISEKAKTLVSSKSGLSLSPPAYTLSRLLNDPSDLQRLAKARKLRELLRQELHKEKKIKKAKARPKEYSLDPAKMTMRDLIRYLPMSNPMPSSLEAPENETVVPSSPEQEESPEKAQEPEVPAKIASPREEEEEEEEEEAAAAEEDQDDAPMVPQVKVAEDGSLIIDEESLTVEVQRAKGPNTIQDRDPIFERGSTTTYSSFRKGTYSKPWSNEETDMFFLAISMVGTDFSMICQLFPHRARSEIKNKFKKEERANAWRIDKAFRERRKLDIEYFSKLLEKILEVQKNRKKLKSLAEKNSPKKRKRRAKGKKAARKLSDVEEEDEEEEKEMPDLEEEGEKENEGGTPVPKSKKKRKRKTKEDGSTEEPNDKKNKKCEKSSDQDEAYIPEETEAALPEDRTNSDMSEKTENAAKDTTIKPAKLSRGRAPKPLLPLGRKLGKKSPAPSTKAKDSAADKGEENVSDKEQGNKDASPIRQADKRMSDDDDISSGEEDASVQPPRPTRYGRVPKPTKPLTYPAKDDPHSSASEATPASPATSTASAAKPKTKCTAKRGRSSKPQSTQESKKPKLVTLRASQSESSDEGYEQQWEEEELEKEQHPSCSKDSIAPAFVPASLRSPQPVISEVEETMEELDILANMPDVLGISQDALCPDSSFELAQNETGTAEPCEHQLDLLVDVIDFLSSEHTEVSEDESYNEAAQTLLTIGNMAHLSQSAQNLATDIQDHTTEMSVSVDDTIQNLEEEIASQPAAQEENSATSLMAATSGKEIAETSETVAVEELQNRKADCGDQRILESSDQRTGSDPDPTPQMETSPEKSKKNPPQTRKGRLSKVKPMPNLGQASRTAKSKSQPETNTKTIDEESHTVAPKDTQATETLSAAEETPKIADSSQELSKDEISCIEVKLTEEPSGSQEKSVGQEKSGVGASAQSTSNNQSQCFSDTNIKSTDEVLISNVHTIKTSVNNLVTSDTEVPESQGINIYSDQVQQSSAHAAPCVTPVEDLPVCQKEESEDASPCQTKKSRFQRVKPKPNFAKTSRTVHSKPQTTEDNVKTDSNPTENPNFHEKAIEVEPEPECTTSPEKPRKSTAPSSDLIPSLDLGSTLTPAEELPITEEKKTDVGDVVQVESGVATSDWSASENRNPQLESRMEQDNRNDEDKLTSTVGTTESSRINLLISDSAVPESQVGQGSDMDSAMVQESSDHPAPFVTPVDPPASQKEVNEDPSTHQARKRFQRFKPKPNVTQTSKTLHSKTVTTKETVEKGSSPTTSPKFHEKTIMNVETDPTCTISTEKPSQSTGPDSDWTPSWDLGSTVKPTEALSAVDEKKTDVAQVESVSATTGQRASENLESEAQLEPSTSLDTRDIKPKSEPIEEKRMTQVGTTETSCSNLLTLNSAILESQVGHEPNIDSASIQESSDHPDLCVTPVLELPSSEKEKGEEPSTHEARKSRFQRVRPKPNLPQTSRAVRSKPQTTKDPVTHMQPAEKPSGPTPMSEPSDKTKAEEGAQPTCSTTPPERPSQIKSTGAVPVSVPSSETCSSPTEGLSSAEVQKTDAGSALDSNLEGLEQNVPRRRQHLPKIKPNLGLSTRTTPAKDSKPSEPHYMSTSVVTSEQQPVDINKFTEKDIKHLTSVHCSLERVSSTQSVPAVSEKSGGATTSSTDVLADSVIENKSSEKSTIEKQFPPDKVVSASSSQLNSKRDITLRATETSTKPTDDPTAISEVQSSKDRSAETEIKTAKTESIPDPEESTQHPHPENEPEAQGQSAVHQYPEMIENKKDDQSTDDNESKPANSSKSSRKAPQTRRGRLVKPKPNLGSKSQPPRLQVKNAKQSEADSATCSEGVDDSLPVSELQSHSQEPVEGAIEQHSNQSSPQKDAGSSLASLTQQPNQHDPTQNVAGFSPGCLTQVPDNYNQDASTSGTGGTQSQPSLTIFPDMLPEQMPSDPDEPFFILSLTEIPVCSSGDVSDPYLPVTDASMQQQSVTGESLAFAGDGPLSNVAVTVSPEESGETGCVVKDEAAHTQSSSLENPVDTNEIPGVQPSKLPDTEENNDETEPPPTKQRLKCTGRTAKVQVKPKTPRQKQARKTLPAKEEESTRDSELPGPSVETKISDGNDHLDVEKNTLTCGKDLDDCSTGAQTTQTRRIRSQNRKPQDNSAASSKPPPGKAASKGPQVKTPRTAGKRSKLAAVASTPHDVAPTPSPALLPENTNSALLTQAVVDVRQTSEHSRLHSDAAPSTSSGTAEVSAFQQSDNVESCLMEDEPTSVSQYFLCDIFTDVEEG